MSTTATVMTIAIIRIAFQRWQETLKERNAPYAKPIEELVHRVAVENRIRRIQDRRSRPVNAIVVK